MAKDALDKGLDVMLHMTCINMTEELLIKYLIKAKDLGVRSILCLRGDKPEVDGAEGSKPKQRFTFAMDMVKFIREKFKDMFSIGVAGYPAGHPESKSFETDLVYLKQKVDAGADFIVTQLFFDVSTFVTFVTSCRSLGVTCPIIPGVLPIRSADSLRHITTLSKLEVPQKIRNEIESRIKDPSLGSILDYGRDFTAKLCTDLLNCGYVHGIHFYTLNTDEPTISVLKCLNLWNQEGNQSIKNEGYLDISKNEVNGLPN